MRTIPFVAMAILSIAMQPEKPEKPKKAKPLSDRDIFQIVEKAAETMDSRYAQLKNLTSVQRGPARKKAEEEMRKVIASMQGKPYQFTIKVRDVTESAFGNYCIDASPRDVPLLKQKHWNLSIGSPMDKTPIRLLGNVPSCNLHYWGFLLRDKSKAEKIDLGARLVVSGKISAALVVFSVMSGPEIPISRDGGKIFIYMDSESP